MKVKQHEKRESYDIKSPSQGVQLISIYSLCSWLITIMNALKSGVAGFLKEPSRFASGTPE